MGGCELGGSPGPPAPHSSKCRPLAGNTHFSHACPRLSSDGTRPGPTSCGRTTQRGLSGPPGQGSKADGALRAAAAGHRGAPSPGLELPSWQWIGTRGRPGSPRVHRGCASGQQQLSSRNTRNTMRPGGRLPARTSAMPSSRAQQTFMKQGLWSLPAGVSTSCSTSCLCDLDLAVPQFPRRSGRTGAAVLKGGGSLLYYCLVFMTVIIGLAQSPGRGRHTSPRGPHLCGA